MITYLLGLPGSGKTYFAVDRIYNNFSSDKEAVKDKKVTFKNCYTNINEFQFNKIKNVYSLDFEVLYNILERLHKLYKAKKKDKYLVKFLRRIKLKDTLFVIDEAHNYFDKKDLILVWWLSYHRHLFHEIILITQNLSLIESKYKSFSEFFYVAKPQSLTLFKSHFKYNIFCSSRLSEKSKSGSVRFKKNQKVFSLYHSGDSISTSNVILKFVIMVIFMIIFLIFFVYFVVLKHDITDSVHTDLKVQSKVNKVSIQKEDSSNIVNTVNDNDIDFLDKKLITMNCSRSSCFYKNYSYPPQLLAAYIDSEDLDLIYKDSSVPHNSILYLSCNRQFYNFLFPHQINKGPENEENNDSFSIFAN